MFLPDTKRRLLPLTKDSELFQATLKINRLRLVLVKRPPCVSEGYLEQHQHGIALALQNSPGLHFNGVRLERPALITHGRDMPHRIFQPANLTIGAVFMREGDGYLAHAERSAGARVNYVKSHSFVELQSLFGELFILATREPARFACPRLTASMEQDLSDAINDAFASSEPGNWVGRATSRYVCVCRRVDDFLQACLDQCPSNEEVAAAVGVTTRTLHNAMMAVRGMSLRRFMTLRRLWAVRAALQNPNPFARVKTAAFDQGFWHMGRFARIYRSFFGELPSATKG